MMASLDQTVSLLFRSFNFIKQHFNSTSHHGLTFGCLFAQDFVSFSLFGFVILHGYLSFLKFSLSFIFFLSFFCNFFSTFKIFFGLPVTCSLLFFRFGRGGGTG